MKFHIQDELRVMIEEGLEFLPPEIIEHKCPRCGGIMCYPVIARERDLETFQTMLDAFHFVMDKYEVPKQLLADLRMQIAISLARKNST